MCLLAKRRNRSVRYRKNVCVVIETLKTGHLSTKNVNKNETEHKVTHTITTLRKEIDTYTGICTKFAVQDNGECC